MVEATSSAGSAAGGRGTVLVIDDCTTVRLRARQILERHDYHVFTAADGAGGLEETRRVRPDAILVDFVMPRMNGYQFCRAVRDAPDLATIPLILMSVKVDRIGEQFVRHGLADDALSKPFQPAALLAVLEHRIGRRSERLRRESPAPEEPAPSPAPPPDPQVEALRRTERAMENARGVLVDRLADVVAGGLELDGDRVDVLRAALGEAITESLLRELVPALSGLDPHAGLPSFSGAIEALPIGEVFQMIALQNLTGVMEIEGPGLKARVYLRDGKIDVSRLDGGTGTFRLGNYLVQEDLVAPQEIDRLVEQADPDGSPLGERLIRLGIIGREDLGRALQRQATDIFYEVLRWSKGLYRFVPDVRPEADARDHLPPLPVSALLMEGYRRVDEWRLIEREIRSFDEVYEQNPVAIEQLDASALATEEKLVLDQVTGSRPVSDVIRTVRLGAFETCRILYRMLSLKLIHRRRAREAPLPPLDPGFGLV